MWGLLRAQVTANQSVMIDTVTVNQHSNFEVWRYLLARSIKETQGEIPAVDANPNLGVKHLSQFGVSLRPDDSASRSIVQANGQDSTFSAQGLTGYSS